MKGIVFNLLQEVVCKEYGEDTWDQLLDDAGLDGAYTSLGSYADAEVVALVNAASAALNLPAQDILRWFGRRAMPLLAERYPGFFQRHQDARSFILTLNSIIHPEVEKLYPGAATPVFDFSNDEQGRLVVGYKSARKMCALAEGFMTGAADHYHEQTEIDHPVCMHHGDEKCVFHVRFHK